MSSATTAPAQTGRRFWQRLPEELRCGPGFLRAVLLPAHTWLVALYFTLVWFHQIQDFVPLGTLFAAMGGLLAGALLLRAFFLLLLADRNKAALAATIFALWFLFCLDIYSVLQGVGQSVNRLWITRTRWELLIEFGLWAGSLLWLWRTPRRLVRPNSAATAAAATLLCLQLWSVATFRPSTLPPQGTDLAMLQTLPAPTNQLRDIYLIVMDSRTSSESLKRFWNYDDSAFRAELEQHGFKILPAGYTYYNFTPYCISALLNAEHPRLPAAHPRTESVWFLSQAISRSPVVTYLERCGYEIINLSLFDLPNAPRRYPYFGTTPARSLFNKTLPGVIYGHYFGQRPLTQINLDILRTLNHLPPRQDARPRFVYAHLMMPHVPYVFDRHGNLTGKNPSRFDKDAYLEQLIYTDRVVLDAIKNIQAASPLPPVIILQGDHGFRFLQTPDRLEESHTILNAYSLPAGGDKLLFKTITPVNSFRVVLNHYFGARLPFVTATNNLERCPDPE